MAINTVLSVETAMDLKSMPSDSDRLPILTMGLNTINDGYGGWYYWDSSSVAAADDNNVIQVTGVVTGRYIRVTMNSANGAVIRSRGSAKVINIGGYIIYTNSGTVSGGNGEVAFNLTTDGTAGGTAIFTTVYASNCEPTINTTSAPAKGSMNRKSLSVDNKVITFTGATGTTLLALGATTVQIPNGTVCNCFVVGI